MRRQTALNILIGGSACVVAEGIVEWIDHEWSKDVIVNLVFWSAWAVYVWRKKPDGHSSAR